MAASEDVRQALDQAGKTMSQPSRASTSASYLEAVDTVWHLLSTISLSHSAPREKDNEILDEAQSLLQFAMYQMEDEFRRLIEQHSKSVDPEWLFDPVANPSFGSISDDRSAQTAAGDESGEGEEKVAVSPRSNLKLILDMLPPDIVPILADVAARMINCGYKMECCQQYIQHRKAILEESLFRLGMEKFSLEDVQKMTPETLVLQISKWMKALSVSVGVFLPSEKQLCEQVFAEHPSISEWCFAEVAKGAMIQLLNFAEAVAIGHRCIEMLPSFIDMYKKLGDRLGDIESLFSDSNYTNVSSEAADVLCLLGEAVRGTFVEFASAIKGDFQPKPVSRGAVHPLTQYVMNYLRLLSCFSSALNEILGNPRGLDSNPIRSDENSVPGYLYEGTNARQQHGNNSPLSMQIVYLIELLEENLDGKANFYRDSALQYLFLINNFRYIVQKVKASELRRQVSGDWLRRHKVKARKLHNHYLRVSWHKVLSCLSIEGIHSAGSPFPGGVSKSVLKDRFKQFNVAFEEVVNNQQNWAVSDIKLRQNLRISSVQMLLPAYRAFLGRFQNHLESEKNSERFLKYSAEDIESILNDLFEEGTSAHRRGFFSTS